MPVIPATQEAEAVELFEPGWQRLLLTKIMPLHSSLSNRAKLRLKTNKQTNKQKKKQNCSEYSLAEKIYNALFYSVLEYIQQLHMFSHVKYKNSVFKRIKKSKYYLRTPMLKENGSEYSLLDKIYNALFYSLLEYIHQISMLSHVK